MKKEIQHQIFVPHAIEVVWDYLTKPELLSQWLMDNDIKPILGHNFHFRSKPALEIDFDGMVHCEILEVMPPKKLSYSWKCNPKEGNYKINTIVAWTLNSKDEGTELILHQTGFKDGEYEKFYLAMKNGWSYQMDKLMNHLNNQVK